MKHTIKEDKVNVEDLIKNGKIDMDKVEDNIELNISRTPIRVQKFNVLL